MENSTEQVPTFVEKISNWKERIDEIRSRVPEAKLSFFEGMIRGTGYKLRAKYGALNEFTKYASYHAIDSRGQFPRDQILYEDFEGEDSIEVFLDRLEREYTS